MPSSVPPVAPAANAQFGPYTLLDRLAVGSVAEVFRARKRQPAGGDRTVVVKRMLPDIANRPESRQMFEVEADLGMLVRHDNVVEVLARGEAQDRPYLELEYVRGMDLWRLGRWLMQRQERLRPSLSVYVVRRMLAGLSALHGAKDAQGRALEAVHRDVSPSNVLLSIHGDVKLADFGIAYAHLREHMPQATMNPHAKGKLAYLAPEQVTGEPVDRRADIFSAGIVVAELLMGAPLFASDSELLVLLGIRDARIEPFQEMQASLPRGLGEVVERALSRNPDHRFQDAAELAAALEPYEVGPEADHARELGGLVRTALRLTSDTTQRIDPEESGGPSTRLQPSEVERAPTMQRPIETSSGQNTRESKENAKKYRVRTRRGKKLGPLSYADVVGAIATGELGPNDEVAADRKDDWKSIHRVPSLGQHVSGEEAGRPLRRRGPDSPTSLAQGGFVCALLSSLLRRETGKWLCKRGAVCKEVYVVEGIPAYVTSNLSTDLLGEYLVGRKVITRRELEDALAQMPDHDGRLGDTVTAMGLIEPVELFRHISSQVQGKLLDVFLWDSGETAFFPGVTPPVRAFHLGLNPWKLIGQGVERRLERAMDLDLLEREGTLVLGVMPENLELPADLRRALSLMETPRTLVELEEALIEAGDSTMAAQRAMVILARANLLTWAEPAA